MMNNVNMSYIPMILKYTDPESVPVSFKIGRKIIKGIPSEFKPNVCRKFIDSNVLRVKIEGKNRSGLAICAEYTEYRDFPVTEWRVSLTMRVKRIHQ